MLSAAPELSYSLLVMVDATLETYQLFHYDFCPFCMRVRRFLEQAGIGIPLRNIHQEAAAYRELVQGGGSQQVPCLRIEADGAVRWLYESADIIQYLDTRRDALRGEA